MTELTLKDLKAVLDENILDLSLRQIKILPTKALRLLPRATEIDFSNNLVSIIEPEFCSLVHVTKLDLSSNLIEQLPSNFGDLINLFHLDLYKNEITDLPLSFGNLKALKWLDLKDNPLVSDLAKIADDCFDKKGCTQAAVRVVRLMQIRAERLEEREVVQTRVASEVSNNDQNPQKEKAKKKKKKHKELASNQPLLANSEFIDDERRSSVEERNVEESFETVAVANQVGHSVVSWIVKKLLTFSLIFFGLLMAFLVGNCFFENFEGPLQASKPFCTDLHNAVYHQSLSSDIFNNFLTSLKSVFGAFDEKISHFCHCISDNQQILALKRIFSPLTSKLTSVLLLLQGHFMHSIEDAQKFYDNYASDSVNSALKEAWLIIRVIALMLADLIMFIVEKGVLFISSAVENLVDFAQHSDTLMRFLRN